MNSSRIKVIYMGTPEFSVLPLRLLAQNELFEILAVVTQPDAPVGRKQVLTAPPVKIEAQKHNLTVLQPEKVKKNTDFLSFIKKLKPQIIVTAAYGKILPLELIEIPEFGAINIHASLLPKYRGASPIEESLLHGDHETGLTFIKMDEQMDTGDVLLTQRLKIEENDTSTTLRSKLSILAAELLPFVLSDFIEGSIKPVPQDHPKATYCKKIEKDDGIIDPATMTAQDILNKIRALNPWPSTFMTINGKKLKILGAELVQALPSAQATPPGTFTINKDNKELLLNTAKGVLKISVLQIEGKNQMSAHEFLRGHENFFIKAETSAK